MNWINELKLFLLDNERTASWLARKCNVSPAAVKYWFDGTTTPTFKNRKTLHEITGIKI